MLDDGLLQHLRCQVTAGKHQIADKYKTPETIENKRCVQNREIGQQPGFEVETGDRKPQVKRVTAQQTLEHAVDWTNMPHALKVYIV